MVVKNIAVASSGLLSFLFPSPLPEDVVRISHCCLLGYRVPPAIARSIRSIGEMSAEYSAGMLRGLTRAGVSLAGLLLVACTSGPAGPTVAPEADLPLRQSVASWAEAAALAGVPLYAPPVGVAGTPVLEVRGVAMDPTRPVWATYPSGLRMIQAHRDVLPAPHDENEFFEVPGADEAWRGDAGGEPYVLIRRGETLVLLSGAPDEQMVAASSALEPVGGER